MKYAIYDGCDQTIVYWADPHWTTEPKEALLYNTREEAEGRASQFIVQSCFAYLCPKNPFSEHASEASSPDIEEIEDEEEFRIQPPTWPHLMEKQEERPWAFPWPKPTSMFDTDGPEETLDLEVGPCTMRITPTNEDGVHSGRTRYHVECLTCKKVIHEATTGGSVRIEQHRRSMEKLKNAV